VASTQSKGPHREERTKGQCVKPPGEHRPEGLRGRDPKKGKSKDPGQRWKIRLRMGGKFIRAGKNTQDSQGDVLSGAAAKPASKRKPPTVLKVGSQETTTQERKKGPPKSTREKKH